ARPVRRRQLAGFAELFENILRARALRAVVTLEALFHLLRRRYQNSHIFPEREPQILRRAQIERIDENDTDQVVAQSDRQRALEAREASRNRATDFGLNF